MYSCFIIIVLLFYQWILSLPPYSCTLSCNFVNVYTIGTRVHAHIPSLYVQLMRLEWWTPGVCSLDQRLQACRNFNFSPDYLTRPDPTLSGGWTFWKSSSICSRTTDQADLVKLGSGHFESDVAPLNIGLATAYHRAQNRLAWRTLNYQL